jgi:hypothetical protein
MAKIKSVKTYSFSKEDFENMRKVTNNNIALCLQPLYDKSSNYWITKYKIDDYKNVSYMRIDTSKPDSPNNRIVLNEFEALRKIAEHYKLIANKL